MYYSIVPSIAKADKIYSEFSKKSITISYLSSTYDKEILNIYVISVYDSLLIPWIIINIGCS